MYDANMRMILAFLFIATGCASFWKVEPKNGSQPKTVEKKPEAKQLEFYEVAPDKTTALLKQNLYHAIQIYDLTRFMYTYRVKIQDGVFNHSHPILTLNTKYARMPNKLMASFLHQQFHWWANSHPNQVRAAIKDFEKAYPKNPGLNDEDKKHYYLHLIVSYLEFRTMGKLIGYHQTHRIQQEMLKVENHYSWAYEKIYQNPTQIRTILRKHNLIPYSLN